MRYQRCKKAELVAFADSRGLKVSSSLRRGASRRAYIAALRRADRDATFRFLDLPAELRNLVYEELLILRDSFSCFPQILQASKEVNREASGILYGANYIDIKIYPDGIFVHGQRCGNYQPALLQVNRRVLSQDFTTTPWPDYLGRAQYLRLVVPDEHWALPGAPTSHGRGVSVGNVTYSLCQMLRHHNSLRAMRVVVQPVATSGFEDIKAMYHPLRLMGDIALDIVDFQDNSLANFFADHENSQLATISTWAILKAICDCVAARSKLDTAITGVFAPGTLGAACLALGCMVFAAARDFHGTTRSDDSFFPLGVFHTSIQQIRASLETCNALRVHISSELLVEVYRLLCLEIDFTCQFSKLSSGDDQHRPRDEWSR